MSELTDPPFYPHGEHMICGDCGLVMGRLWLLQLAHIGWHRRTRARA